MPGPREDERRWWPLLRSWQDRQRRPERGVGDGDDHGEEADDDRLEDPAERPPGADHGRADAELVECMRKYNFEGAVYAAFTDYMYRYAISVLRNWLRTGKIFAACREIGIGLPPPPPGWADEEYADDREDLVMRTVVRAMNSFRQRALVEGVWRPDGGASLRTFFIGRCKGEFANVYRAWHRKQADRPADQELTPQAIDRLADPHPGPEAQVMMTSRVREAFAKIPNKRTRAAVFFTTLGYSQAEIAEILDCSERAVEGLLRRHRENHPVEGGFDDVPNS